MFSKSRLSKIRDLTFKKNSSYLDFVGLRYLLPLQSNTKEIDDAYAALPGARKFDGLFIYHDRPVWYTRNPVVVTGHYLCIFQDDAKKLQMQQQYLKKLAQNYERYSCKNPDWDVLFLLHLQIEYEKRLYGLQRKVGDRNLVSLSEEYGMTEGMLPKILLIWVKMCIWASAVMIS